jgi:Cd2+/Zn2+-exporting ATPase/Cu+-exporting ATPase
LVRIGLVAIASVAVWLRLWEPLARVSVIGLTASLVGGYPIFEAAFSALRARRMTMELSMTIAVGAALAIGEFFTALVILLFVLVAEVLERLTVGRGRRAIKDLLDFLPQQALVRRGDVAREVGAAEIAPGDDVVVRPGGRLPVDGVVVAGHSFVDQATITGESLPVEKVPGAQVYAGTINQSGTLDVRAIRIGRDTAFGKIIEAVEAVERSRAPIQKTADRLAGYLVYFAIGCAALTFVFTRDVRSTISVVIVAGACGIAAGTPLAILGAIGQAARNGAIVKGGRYLEALSQVDTVVLDKTGTLTYGDPEVVEIHAAPGATVEAVLAAAAIAERPSEHPMGKAILKRAAAAGLPVLEPERFAYAPGKGVVCLAGGEEIVVGNRAFLTERAIDVTPCAFGDYDGGEVHVARGRRSQGDLHVADVLRPEARDAVAALRHMGLRVILLTGDNEAVASAVASSARDRRGRGGPAAHGKARAHRRPARRGTDRRDGRRRHQRCTRADACQRWRGHGLRHGRRPRERSGCAARK